MSFSDYLEETEGYFGWSQKEDYNSWCTRMRRFRDDFVRSTQSDSISGRVRESNNQSPALYGERQGLRKIITKEPK
ncbi:MAG: hypothetical protein WBB28_14370 [Crinalium sp.]